MKIFLKNTLCLCFSLISLLVLVLGCSPKPTFTIIDKPITWNEEREALSLQYLKDRHGLEQENAVIDPKMVVVHWTAIDNIEVTFDVFDSPTLGGREDLTSASNLNVSSQFLIDRDGTIFRLLPDTYFARHVIGLNYTAIGIENIGSSDWPLTKAQLKANEELIRYLKRKYQIEYVIGHHEYTLFQETDLWKEADPDYRTVKTDPGDKFMNKLRKNLSDLELKPLPKE
ncbi:N-acetylmuramoyl-L-alanine amidase [Algoriphagus sediminis]|uniref:N-acetylmuramoyl-L-alanine amidase n=1 Tax=Algoriphagus sediminis TaxID=3057113 RepID=A0ABT7YHB8_9BACT|nr:peptidoglycan recognition family protein [Algoriphagus sediminis]MDN3205900.1 peptidoglycan recognition family protein [Algoriphagus sediminis]